MILQYQQYLLELHRTMNESKTIIEPLTYDQWVETSKSKLFKKGAHNTFINEKLDTYFFINVSKHAYEFDNSFSGMLFSKRKDTGYEQKRFMYLPNSFCVSKQIIGKANDLSEDECKSIIDTIHIEIAPSPYNDWSGDYDIGYIDYSNIGEYAGWGGDAGVFRKAKDSLQSLLQEMNMELETTLIMKKL